MESRCLIVHYLINIPQAEWLTVNECNVYCDWIQSVILIYNIYIFYTIKYV